MSEQDTQAEDLGNTKFWLDGDKRMPPGHKAVMATVSKHGMRAYHSGAAIMTPIGDFAAIGGGVTVKMGLTNPEADGRTTIRPGYEKQVRAQLQEYNATRQARPIELQVANEGPAPVQPQVQEL